MDALTALHSRSSVNLLCNPAPTPEQIDDILKAGLRACDHASLRPWRFLLIQGKARQALGDLMVNVKAAQTGAEVPKELAEKLRSKPYRAPTILVVAAEIKQHPKVPEIEQVLSAGASAQMIMTAAHALGIGAIWRSGSLMFDPAMRQGLGLENNHQIVGFIYMGTPKVCKTPVVLKPEDYLTHWTK